MSIDFDPSSFWVSKVPEDAVHVVVHLRNADDIDSLIAENKKLQEELKKAKQDIFTWTSYGAKYLECLDELRDLKVFLKTHGLSWRFRNLLVFFFRVFPVVPPPR